MDIPANVSIVLYSYRSAGMPQFAVSVRPKSAKPGSRPDRLMSSGSIPSEAEQRFASARLAAGYAVSIAFPHLDDATSFLAHLVELQDQAWRAREVA